MPWATGLVNSTDAYQYFECNGSVFVNIQVFNNGIVWAVRPPGGTFPAQDEPLANSSLSRPIVCDEIRFKSLQAGTPALIAINTQTRGEVPQGNPLSASIVPNYLTINPATGAVTADFNGFIRALGMIITGGTSDVVSGSNEVQFLTPAADPSGAGALLAELVATYQTGSRGGGGSVPMHYLHLIADLEGLTGGAVRAAIRDRTAGDSFTQEKTIIDSSGFSDFIQLTDIEFDSVLTEQQAAMTGGWVTNIGTIGPTITISRSADYLVILAARMSHPANGGIVAYGYATNGVNPTVPPSGSTPVSNYAVLQFNWANIVGQLQAFQVFRKTLVAGDILQGRYYGNNSTCDFRDRILMAIPIG